MYVHTINNRIVFKIKTGYKLELLSKEKMKLLGSTKDTIDADKNSENVPKLENFEVVLVHCNLVNNVLIINIREYYLLLYRLNNMVS